MGKNEDSGNGKSKIEKLTESTQRPKPPRERPKPTNVKPIKED